MDAKKKTKSTRDKSNLPANPEKSLSPQPHLPEMPAKKTKSTRDKSNLPEMPAKKTKSTRSKKEKGR